MDFLAKLSPHVHWGLRASLAATYLFHGIAKIPVEGPMMMLPVPVVWAVALAEIAAGACLIAGAFGKEMLTRVGGFLVIVIMIGAIWLVHLPNGFSNQGGGFEFQLLMIAAGLYFAARGNNV